MELFSLKDQVAVVTGGNSGIGLKTMERFVGAGARVVVADMAESPSFDLSESIKYVRCDVTDEHQVKNALNTAVTEFDGLDVLVNNAGVFSGYEKIVDKYAAELMRDGGRIINTASAAGLIGVSGLADYAASKHAVIGLTKSAALELSARHIRVNCVCPTTVNTPMANEDGGEHMLNAEKLLVPLGRICEPEEVAALIHFLASTDCNFVNGQAIAIDGGMSAGGSERLYEKLIS
jgi:NAD(P)-dependent dehydrogenase (short-subunit alcohol dehydrogenase family)